MQIAEPLAVAIEELSKLPSIGKKTAQRLALFILKMDDERVDNLLKSDGYSEDSLGINVAMGKSG